MDHHPIPHPRLRRPPHLPGGRFGDWRLSRCGRPRDGEPAPAEIECALWTPFAGVSGPLPPPVVPGHRLRAFGREHPVPRLRVVFGRRPAFGGHNPNFFSIRRHSCFAFRKLASASFSALPATKNARHAASYSAFSSAFSSGIVTLSPVRFRLSASAPRPALALEPSTRAAERPPGLGWRHWDAGHVQRLCGPLQPPRGPCGPVASVPTDHRRQPRRFHGRRPVYAGTSQTGAG